MANTQNQAWAKDKSNFGFRMMQKMGWAEGKGLGAKEDGPATHVRVKRRREQQALGAEGLTDMTGNATLTGAVQDYNSILASLKPLGAPGVASGQGAAAAPQQAPPLVDAAVRAKRRPHGRVIRNKDVSRYSATDLSAILGHAPQPAVAAAPLLPARSAAAADAAEWLTAGSARRPRSDSACSGGSVTRQRSRAIATATVAPLARASTAAGAAAAQRGGDADDAEHVEKKAMKPKRSKEERRARRQARSAEDESA